MKKQSTDRKASRGKKKLAARSLPGVWLGVYPRTGEHIIALETGEAIRVRTVHRLAEADRWSMEAVLAVNALPRRPNPNAGEREPLPRCPGDFAGQQDDREDGAGLGEPDSSDALGGPREMRITSRLLVKYGYTDGCSAAPTSRLGSTIAASIPLRAGHAFMSS